MSESRPTREELEQEASRLRKRVAELEEEAARADEPSDTSQGGIDHKSEASLLAAMLDDLPGVAYRACAEEGYRLHYVSRGCERLFGYTVEDFTHEPRLTFEEVCHPEDLERVAAVFERAITNQEPFEVEWRARCKDGTEKWVLQRGGVQPCPQFDKTCIFGFANDITRHRRERDAFEALSIRFQLATEAGEIGIADYDLQTETLNWDDRICAIYGIAPSGFDGKLKTWTQALHPEDRMRVIEAMNQEIESAQRMDTTFRIVRPDGEIRHVRAMATVVRDDAGKPIRVVGVNYDITESRREREALEDLNLRFKLATESAGLGIWDWNVVDNVLVWDAGMHAIYGVPQNVFGGVYEAWKNGVHPEDQDGAEAAVMQALKDLAPYNIAFRVVRPDGDVRHVEAHAVIVRDDAGKALRMTGVNIDVTAEHRAEEALRQRQQYLDTIIQTTADGFHAVDTTGHISDVNPAFCAMTGYARAECRGLSFQDINPWETPEETAARIQRIIEHGSETFETRLQRKDGTPFPTEISVSYIAQDDGMMVGFIRDITERVEAERALRESEARLKALFDSALDVIYLKDRESRYTHVNPAFEKVWGRPASEIVGHSIRELDPSNDSLRDLEQDAKVLEGETTIVEFPRVLKGRFYVFEGIKAPVFDASGAIIGLCGIVRDVTDRRKAEEALRESEARLKALFDSAPDMVFMKDPEHRFTHVNRALLTKFGLTAEDVIGRPDEAFFPADIVKKHQEDDDRALAGRTVSSIYVRDVGGRERILETTKAPVYDKEGRAFAVCGISRDITARVEAEQALRESEARYRAYMDNSPVAIFIADQSTRYIDVNRAACDLLGYSRGEILSMKVAEVDPTFADTDGRSEMEMMRSTGSVVGERPLRRKDGNLVQVLLNGVGLENGHLMAYCIDLTERNLLQEQLQAAQKMEAVGQLAGGIAHDFNNLLQVINGHADFALSELEPEAAPRGHIERIAEAGKRAGLLVGQLLSFSRRQLMRMELLEPNDLLLGITHMLERVIGEHIRVVFSPGRIEASVRGDRGMLEQVVMNLCVNARDAMPRGGELRLSCSVAELDESFCAGQPNLEAGRFVHLCVADTGTGMDEETMRQIFEPFFTTKDPGKGTGLGLATAYGIVQQHGGALTVRSALGEGSAFSVYLPAHAEPVPVKERGRRAEPEARGGGETILLAEDDAMVRGLSCTILERAGYKVLLARDGEEAVQIFSEHEAEISLLLLDVVMPNLGGLEAWELIRRRNAGMPVIFASGYSEGALRADLASAEGVTVIQKPFERSLLLQEIRRCIDEGKTTE